MSSVDVFVPCYNYGRFLRECVESVLDQDGVEVRVLIIDDTSIDDTPEVGQALAADPRVEYRRHPVNRGHIATYNEGIDWASADYALLLSADDVLTPGAFSRAARLMDEHPEVGFTFGRGVTTDRPDYRAHPRPGQYRSTILTGAEFWEISCAEASNVVFTPTAVVRTSLQKKIGGYRQEFPHTGDLEMWLRFAAHAPVGVIDADQGFYRVHGANMHVEMFPERLKVFQQHRDAFDRLFQEYGPLLDGGERLRRMAMRALALGAVRRAGRLLDQGDRVSSRRLADVAMDLFPDVRREREWKRLRWKRLVGPTGTRVLRGLRNAFRRPSAPPDRSPFGRCRVFEGI
jgi:glycosyltransferase involved in cell wall biosynthesis